MFDKFRQNQSGAVTVDWVVLTGAIIGLGIVVLAVVSDGPENIIDSTNMESSE